MRRILPQRRAAETFDLRFWNQPFTVTVGFYADGTPGEVFIDGGKTGNDIQSIARDAGVLLSLALQHGVPPKQSATPSPAARRKSPRRFWARSSIPSQRIHFREASDGCWTAQDFSDAANWQTPQELPICAVWASSRSTPRPAGRGVAGRARLLLAAARRTCLRRIPLAWHEGGKIRADLHLDASPRHRQIGSFASLSLAQGSDRIRRAYRHWERSL